MDAYSVPTIVCRVCHTELEAAAEACHRCGALTREDAPVSPPAMEASASPEARKKLVDRPWFLILLVLHVGCLGIPIYWKTDYPVSTRIMIVLSSIVYTVVAVGLIIWGIALIIQLLQSV